MASAVRATACFFLACFAAPVAAQDDCTMAAADRVWLADALETWRHAESELLGLPAQPLPTVAAIDARCTYLLPQGQFDLSTATSHGDTVVLPDGAEAPLGPISFANGDGGYFAMSLPSVWRAADVTSEVGLERLMTGVLLHEMMHIRQTDVAAEALAGIAGGLGLPDDELTDDIVQERFADDPQYLAAYGEERDALFAAAAAPEDGQARQLATSALDLMRARHARWFYGDAAGFAALDDVFLTMEGMGQWLIYRHFRSADGGALSPAEAVRAVRRGGRWWSQDEGLALLLVVDRLLPGWQGRAFRDPDWRAQNLLAAAIAAPQARVDAAQPAR